MSGHCAECGETMCDCRDDQWSGTLVVDTKSDPGSWERALRHSPNLPTETPVGEGRV